MEKIPLKKITIGLVVVIVIASGFGRVFSSEKNTTTEAVNSPVNLLKLNEFANFEGEINSIGQVEAVNFATLVSETNSTVASRLVNPGDFVVAGQPLVLFDGTGASIQVASAEASLRALEAQLVAQTSEPREEDVSQLKAALDQALAQREQTIRSNKNLIESTERAIDNLYIDGVYNLSTYETTLRLSLVLISDLQQRYFNCGRSVCNQISTQKRNAIREAYEINDGGEFSSLAIQGFDSGVVEDIEILSSEVDYLLFDEVRDDLEKATIYTREALVSLREGFDINPEAFSASASEKSSVEAKINSADSVLSALRALDLSIQSTRGEVYPNGEFEVLNETISEARQARRSVDAAVSSAEARLNALVEGPREIDLAALRAQIDGARAQYAQALEQSSNQRIVAPFDGLIGVVNAPLGQVVPAGQTVVTIFNSNAKRVKISLSADKARTISFHESVLIDEDIPGVIEYVSPQIGDGGGVEVGIIAIDESDDLIIGETVQISIKLKSEQTADSTFSVPLQSIKTNSDGTFVYGVNEESEIVRYSVTTGQIRGSEIELFFNQEIPELIVDSVRGLELGEKVSIN